MKIELEERELRQIIGALWPPAMFGSELIDKLKSYLSPDPPQKKSTDAPVHFISLHASARHQRTNRWICPKCDKHIVNSSRDDGVACVIEYDEEKWAGYPDRCVEFYNAKVRSDSPAETARGEDRT